MGRVAEGRFFRKLGVADPIPPSFRTHLDDAERWFDDHGRPWSASRWVAVDCANSLVRIRHRRSPTLRSDVLARGFRAAGVKRMLLVASSAGDHVDAEIARRFAAGRPDEGFFLATYAEAVAETLRRHELASCGEHLLPHYAPGYAGWDIEDLSVLVHLMDSDRAPITCPAGSVLRPLRSTIVVAGVPAVAIEDTHRYWDRFGGRTCTEVCRPCTCSTP